MKNIYIDIMIADYFEMSMKYEDKNIQYDKCVPWATPDTISCVSFLPDLAPTCTDLSPVLIIETLLNYKEDICLNYSCKSYKRMQNKKLI